MLNKPLLLAKEQKPQGKEFLLTMGGIKGKNIGCSYNNAERFGEITPRTIRFAGQDWLVDCLCVNNQQGIGLVFSIQDQSFQASGKITIFYKQWVKSTDFSVFKGMIFKENFDGSGDKEIFNDWNANFGKTVSIRIKLE